MSASMGSSIIQSRSWHEYSGSNEPEQWVSVSRKNLFQVGWWYSGWENASHLPQHNRRAAVVFNLRPMANVSLVFKRHGMRTVSQLRHVYSIFIVLNRIQIYICAKIVRTTPGDVSVFGPFCQIMDWNFHRWPASYQIWTKDNQDNLKEYFRLCNWFSLWCLLP